MIDRLCSHTATKCFSGWRRPIAGENSMRVDIFIVVNGDSRTAKLIKHNALGLYLFAGQITLTATAAAAAASATYLTFIIISCDAMEIGLSTNFDKI